MRRLTLILISVVLVCTFSSCKSKADQKTEEIAGEHLEMNPEAIGAGKIDNNDSLPGKKVEEEYADHKSKIVCFYKVDENGQLTDEKYREVYYFDSTHYKYVEGDVNKEMRNGPWFAYHKNGNLCTEGYYIDGKEEGPYKVYHENGYLFYGGEFKQGKRVGEWKYYDANGYLVSKETYVDGKVVKKETINNNNINNKNK